MDRKKLALAFGAALAISGCFFEYPDPTVDPGKITFNDLAVHDPSVIRADDGTFYVFGSHLAAARSTDLMNWQHIANGLEPANPLWSTIPLEGTQWTGVPGSWAADVIKLKDGKYRFYYSFCGIPPAGQCNGPRSYLGVAVSDRIDGPFIDQGIFLRSGMTPAEIAAGYGPSGVTSYDARVMPNTIDPDVFYDKRGKLWMVYGSYSGGIFILEMDETTGKPKPGQGYGKHLAGGDHAPIEGGYMLYSPESGFYYLFTSFGGLAANDGYNIRIARSKNPTGPFLDAEGRDMVNARGSISSIEPYGVKMMGGFNFASAIGDPEAERGYLSPGHNSAYYDATLKKHLLITHTRFPDRGEQHSIRVHEMYVNGAGWLVASPHRHVPIQGRNIVDNGDIVGDYKVIDLGKDVNRTARQSVYVSLNADGSITGELTGKFRRYDNDASRVVIVIDRDEGVRENFDAVVQWQWNEATGALTPVFTGVSGAGVSIWGSRMATRTSAEVLADVAAAIVLPTAAKDQSLTLPTRGARGTGIVWSTSNENVIGIDGTVTRPNVGEGDQVVMLTATLELNGESSSRTFHIAVPQRQPFNRVAHYGFENSLAESLGRFAPGTATGNRVWNSGSVGFDTGHDGQALMLNGSNGVRLPPGLITNYEYTVSFWINPAAITRFTPAFFAAVNEQVDPAGFPYSTQWLSFLPESWDGNTMLWSGSERWFDGSAGMRIPPNEWHHLAFSVTQGVVSVYVDGTRRFNAGTISDFFSTRPGVFALGVNYWDLPFNGLIDELRIYEASLSGTEIRALDIDHLTSGELLASAAALLDLGDTSAVRENLALPRTGAYASAIGWVSSNPSVLSNRGAVVRPGRDQPDVDVTLTATLSLEGQIATRSFAVRVKSLAPPVPIAAYRFEDNLAEASGFHAPGVSTGSRVFEPGGSVAFAGGAVGRALMLNGSTGVRLPDNLINDRSYSISVWLNPAAATQFTTAFFGWATDSSWISLVPRGPGAAQHTMLWSGTQWFDGTFNSSIPTGAWSHLVMVVNDGTLTLYLNGALANTMTGFPDVFTPAPSTQFALGVNLWDTPYSGLVDELRIYDEAIAPENVRELFEGNPAS
jgi:arabinan endo-1,5-alpha-L-arabinosidase